MMSQTEFSPLEIVATRKWAVEQLLRTSPSLLDVSVLISGARALADFVLGTNDAEILRAARELADKVKG